MPRKLSPQTTLRRRPTRISTKSHPCRRVALSIARKKEISANLVHYSHPISILGEEHALFVGKNLLARLSGKETEKSFSGKTLLSSNVAKTNEASFQEIIDDRS